MHILENHLSPDLSSQAEDYVYRIRQLRISHECVASRVDAISDEHVLRIQRRQLIEAGNPGVVHECGHNCVLLCQLFITFRRVYEHVDERDAVQSKLVRRNRDRMSRVSP